MQKYKPLSRVCKVSKGLLPDKTDTCFALPLRCLFLETVWPSSHTSKTKTIRKKEKQVGLTVSMFQVGAQFLPYKNLPKTPRYISLGF